MSLSNTQAFLERLTGMLTAGNIKFVENLPMIIPGQFGFNCPSGFREEAF
jgi:hypothetical protein